MSIEGYNGEENYYPEPRTNPSRAQAEVDRLSDELAANHGRLTAASNTTAATTPLDGWPTHAFQRAANGYCAVCGSDEQDHDPTLNNTSEHSDSTAATPLVTPITVTQIESEYHEFKAADGRIIMLVDILPEHAALIVQAVNSFDALLRLAGEVATLKPYGDPRNVEIRDTAQALIAALAERQDA